MKHRSVIAFVIVAAALFSAPQLSHDLQSLKSGLGARLRGELLQAFLSLHPEDAAAPAGRGAARSLVASCSKNKADAPAAKAKKDEPRAAAESKSEGTADEVPAAELAVITATESAAERLEAFGEAVATRAEAAAELAMIIPPDAGIEPPALARANATGAKARETAAQKYREAEHLRRVTFVSTRFHGGQAEWHGQAEEALRKLSETLPGNFDLRLEGNGAKSKTVKVIKRAVEAGRPAAAPAPRAPRLPGMVACNATALTVGSQELPAGE